MMSAVSARVITHITEPPFLVDSAIQVRQHPLFDRYHPDMRELETFRGM